MHHHILKKFDDPKYFHGQSFDSFCQQIKWIKNQANQQKIKELSIHFGAEVPFDRPKKIASDFSTKDEVINHAVSYLHNEYGEKYDYVIYLQPTSPMRRNKELIFALSSTMEGDTTNFYIYKQIEKFNIKTSTIARGISVGDELEYADEVTLGRSIVNRIPFEQSIKG